MKKILLILISLFVFIPFIVNAETCDTDKISIESINLGTKSEDVSEINPATIDGKNININIKMSNVGDKIEYIIEVKNDSQDDYQFDETSININTDYMEYTVTSEDNSKIVKANSTKQFTITAEYKTAVPNDLFVNGSYSDNKSMDLVLSNGEESNNLADQITNPKTGVNTYIFTYFLLILITVGAYIIASKKSFNKFMVFIFGLFLIIPISSIALCKYDINVTSSVVIEQPEIIEEPEQTGPYLNINKNKYYDTMNDAFSDAASNQTIKVLENRTETKEATVPAGITGLKLDLNGKSVVSKGITNNGELDIYNTSETEGKISKGGPNYVIYNNGTLTINDTSDEHKVKIALTDHRVSNGVVYNAESKSLTINDNVEIINTYDTTACVNNYGTAMLNGGIYTATEPIDNTKNGVMYISGNNTQITSSSSNAIENCGTIYISGGNISGSNYGLNNKSYVVNSTYYSGTAFISGGTITGGNYGIYSVHNVTISNGTISGKYGLYSDGNAVITGGTITGTTNGIRIYGGTTTLGTNDYSVDQFNPLIKGTGSSGSGVYISSGGTFNFYDGLIQAAGGTNKAITGNGSVVIPDGFEIHKDLNDGVESAFLTQVE